MNPRPTADTLALCYPDGYGPHQASKHSTAQQSQHDASLEAENCVAELVASSKGVTEKHVPWYLSRNIRRLPGLRSFYYWLSDDRSEYLPTPSSETAKAIELGCATGQFLERLRTAGWTAEGVELVETPAVEARRKGFQVHIGTLESARLPSDSYNGAFAWHVIEHLLDPVSTLSEVHRILKDDGILSFSVPNVGCWEPYIFGKNWFAWDLPRHLHFFSPGSIQRLLHDSGFDQIQITHQRNALYTVGSIGVLIMRCLPGSQIAKKLMTYPDHPRLWWQLLLAPAAIFLAAIRQGGRLTVIARCNKSLADSFTENEKHSSESA
jgi:SAM-dependent methyltransferase